MVLEKAKSKIQTEMDQNKTNPYIQAVGGYLLGYLTENPSTYTADKILANDKTIAKSLDAMRTEAQKKKVGNCAVLTDAEGFAIVLKYFGLEPTAVTPKQPPAQAPRPAVNQVDFNISLDDLL